MPYPLVDAHLDLAYNALENGWDLTLPLAELRRRVQGPYRPTVTLPALEEAGVAVAFATLFVDPGRYPDPADAARAARRQLALYRRWEAEGRVRILERRGDLAAHLARWREDRRPGLVLLIEGAQFLSAPEDAANWYRQGVRILGPAWKDTRFAGGTGGRAGLSAAGRELLAVMEALGMALDLAHLSEAAFFETLEAFTGPVLVSHANPRARAWRPGAKTPENRHLSEAALRALAGRDAVVGVVLYNRFLDPGWDGATPVPLARVAEHARHLAARLGWERVGIGSDFDGGFGSEATPEGLDRPAGLWRLEALLGEKARGVLGGHWLRWLADHLPG